MRLAATLSLFALLSAGPVLADPSTTAATGVASAGNACGWSAQMEEDEGGPVMVASSCESDTETGPAFRLMCGDGISIRYNGNGLGMGDNPPASSTLVLTSDGKSLKADVLFEEMDGAFAAYVDMDSPVIAMLKSGSEVGVSFKGADLPPRIVSLKGSTAAIDKLIGDCE
jgi:hypothetical protein